MERFGFSVEETDRWYDWAMITSMPPVWLICCTEKFPISLEDFGLTSMKVPLGYKNKRPIVLSLIGKVEPQQWVIS